ncbi:max-binding protein MNT isoform X2 [Amia ocellicauda]|uniref:max-binding protein MNT isoform X2 n=1 Tax=Amia ocellicauda TaxID=2972642 RepID=UPI0034644CD3
MSIETLLEAARFLEWQAQQQRAREESELREKLRLDREAEQKRAEVTAPVLAPVLPLRVNHVTGRGERACPEQHPSTAPPPPLPPPPPVAVIPVPVVTASPAATPHPLSLTLPAALPAALSPPAAPRLSPPSKEVHSPAAPPPQLQQCPLLGPQVKAEPSTPPQAGSPKQQQQQQQQPVMPPYPGSIIATSQHALLSQGVSLQVQPGAGARPGSLEDARNLDQKRRPGGRAHLKECFETLKRNIPNVDEKKTSNLSVLRSALRYIQTLKRKEKEYEHEMERLAREKIATQQRLAELKNELSQWMDVMEIDRVLRQTVQPEDDQASTSTASEGEDNIDQDIEDERLSALPASLPKVPQLLPISASQPDILKAVTASSLLPPHLSLQHKMPQPLPVTLPLTAQPPPTAAPLQAQTAMATPTVVPAHTHIMTAPSMQPTVIAHAATASHASVIQAVNHVIQAGSKHIAHIAPSSSNSVQLAPAPQPIGHITVHPVTHLSQHLPTIYPQPVAVTQPTVMSHIAHTLSHAHAQVNGTAPSQQAAAMVGKQTAVGAQVVTHHPQLVGQTVLNPVTMVTMPSFPVSTLKLA